MMTKVVIVDDKQLGIDSLKWEIKRLEYQIEVVATFTNPQEAIVYLKSSSIDLLFLDIQMPEMSGFDLLERLDSISFGVIFATAYDEFALRAFKFSALEYLLKPIDPLELKVAFTKFLSSPANKTISTQLDVYHKSKKGGLPDKVIFTTKESLEFIDPKNISFCEADSNYTTIYLDTNKLVVSKTLKDVEQMLLEYNFIRIHSSYLINPIHIKRYLKADGGSVVMTNGTTLNVSRSKKEEFLKRIL